MTSSAQRSLSPRAVVGEVLSVYRRHWRFLVPAAIVILLPQALADALLDGVNVEGVRSAGDLFILAAVPLTVAVGLLGEAIYAGLTAAAVVEWRAGHPLPGPLALARSLPIGRLIAVDLILSVGAAAGFTLLVVPGLIFLAYFGIAPAVLKIEHAGVRGSLRRSATLVRGHFWPVMTVIVGLMVLTEIATQAITVPFHGLTLLTVVDLLAEGAIEPFQGLATVTVTLALLQLRDELPAPGELVIAPVGA